MSMLVQRRIRSCIPTCALLLVLLCAPLQAAEPAAPEPEAPATAEQSSGHAGHAHPGTEGGVPAASSGSLELRAPEPAAFPLKDATREPPDIEEHLGAVIPAGILMTDDKGNQVDVLSLMDIPALIMPVFYTCPAGCNTLQSSVAGDLPQVSLEPGKDYRVISVSFDEHDTPEAAARKKNTYLAAMDYAFPEEQWVFLTGSKEAVDRFMNALGFPFIRVAPDNFVHPLAVIVTAPGGKIVRYLYGQSFMPFDLTMALTEAAEGKTGLSVKRMLAYCFNYDPASNTYVFSFMRVAGLIVLFGLAVFVLVLVLGGRKRRLQ